MSSTTRRITTAWICLAAIGLTACSTSRSSAVGSPEFYWKAAAETYAAGDYAKTLDDLDQLAAGSNPYTARAIAWRLAITSGVARGYMDLADRYTSGARINKAGALAFRLKATKYRKMAAAMAVRFAEQTDALAQVPLGSVSLAFPFPKGSAAEPTLLARVGAGIDIPPAEQEAAETAAIERGVLMAVCAAAGAPNDVAKASEILNSGNARTPRAAFGEALAQTLKTQSALFARDKLDEPEKAALFEQRAERVRLEGARVGSARIGLVVSAESNR